MKSLNIILPSSVKPTWTYPVYWVDACTCFLFAFLNFSGISHRPFLVPYHPGFCERLFSHFCLSILVCLRNSFSHFWIAFPMLSPRGKCLLVIMLVDQNLILPNFFGFTRKQWKNLQMFRAQNLGFQQTSVSRSVSYDMFGSSKGGKKKEAKISYCLVLSNITYQTFTWTSFRALIELALYQFEILAFLLSFLAGCCRFTYGHWLARDMIMVSIWSESG